MTFRKQLVLFCSVREDKHKCSSCGESHWLSKWITTSAWGDDSSDSSKRRRDLWECSWTHVWTFEMLAVHHWIRVWHIYGLFTSQMGWFEGPPHWSEVSIPSADLDCESLVSDLIFLHGCCVTSHWKALVHPHSELRAQNHWCFSSAVCLAFKWDALQHLLL